MSEPTTSISFRITLGQKQLLQEWARIHERTLNGELRLAVREYLERLETMKRKEYDGQAT